MNAEIQEDPLVLLAARLAKSAAENLNTCACFPIQSHQIRRRRRIGSQSKEAPPAGWKNPQSALIICQRMHGGCEGLKSYSSSNGCSRIKLG